MDAAEKMNRIVEAALLLSRVSRSQRVIDLGGMPTAELVALAHEFGAEVKCRRVGAASFVQSFEAEAADGVTVRAEGPWLSEAPPPPRSIKDTQRAFLAANGAEVEGH